MSGDRVVHCIWCMSTRVQPAREFRSERWPMLHCVDCGLRFLSTIPNEDELRRAYAYGRYASETYSLDDRAAAQRLGPSSRILDTLTLHVGHPGRRLKVGCSMDGLLLSVSWRGWTGTDIQIERVFPTSRASRIPVGASSRTMRKCPFSTDARVPLEWFRSQGQHPASELRKDWNASSGAKEEVSGRESSPVRSGVVGKAC